MVINILHFILQRIHSLQNNAILISVPNIKVDSACQDGGTELLVILSHAMEIHISASVI